jgi:hypothetical protein
LRDQDRIPEFGVGIVRFGAGANLTIIVPVVYILIVRFGAGANLTISVPVVYMARDVGNDFDAGNSI